MPDVDERALTERLITYDTSSLEGMKAAAAFVYGWLEARDVEVKGENHNGRPVLAATVGAAEGPDVVLHGHLDVVPAHEHQFTPRVEGDRLIGRGAYDMKGGLAAMMCAVRDLAAQDAVKVHFVCVVRRGVRRAEACAPRTSSSSKGYVGDFAITGEPTDLRIGIQAKGVLGLRLEVSGRSAHGSTPWLGDNAVLKAVDVFRSDRVAGVHARLVRAVRPPLDQPRQDLGRGRRSTACPTPCTIDVDIRYLPGQDPDEILAAVKTLEDTELVHVFHRQPIVVARDEPFVKVLADAVASTTPVQDSIAVGRNGTSDVISFLNAGVPGVEFGPVGDGHHGPDEWVSIESLGQYRRALVEFVKRVPAAVAARPGAGREPADPLEIA